MPSVSERCVCGSTAVESDEMVYGIPTLTCARCGYRRQRVEMSPSELSAWYRGDYAQRSWKQTYAHNLKVANLRLKAYAKAGARIDTDSRMLDVGSGDGSFIAAGIKRGLPIEGLDLAPAIPGLPIYAGEPLEQVAFPTEHYKVITLHDVIEHVVDPNALARELFRILDQDGDLFVDIPDYYSAGGKRHWKVNEHLWLLTASQFAQVFTDAGFVEFSRWVPVADKVSFQFRKPTASKRVKILVPPGIGDVYWSLVKLPGLLRERGIESPEVVVSSLVPGKDRSADYVKRHPFLKWGGYYPHGKDEIWREAYHDCGRTLFEAPDAQGADLFLAYNGVTRHGWSLDEVDPAWGAEWFPKMWCSLEERTYGEALKAEVGGDYLVGYFVNAGMYKTHWLSQFPLEDIVTMLKQLQRETGNLPIVLPGSTWDRQWLQMEVVPACEQAGVRVINKAGDTSVDQLFGMLRSARAVIGYPSGLTIMATMFRTPTVILWSNFFVERFWWNACPPQARGNWYTALGVHQLGGRPHIPVYAALDLLGRGKALSGGLPAPVIPSTAPVEPRNTPYKRLERAPVGELRPTAGERVSGGILTVASVLRSGGDYGPGYVRKLQLAARDTLGEHRFLCLTDIPEEVATACPGIEVRKLEHGWRGWLSKLELFRPDFGLGTEGPVLYLDLDTILIGNGNHLRDALDSSTILDTAKTLWMLRGFRRPDRRASGVMAWRGDLSRIFRRFNASYGKAETEAGRNNLTGLPVWDQIIIHREAQRFLRVGVLQEALPNAFVSFKWDCRDAGAPPPSARVVCFHGYPRPHEVIDVPWVAENWESRK